MNRNQTTRARILVIDDDDQIRHLLVEIFREEYDCREVSSAEDALLVLAQETFDLVISDINMGGISGLEMVPRVLKHTPDTVVVMISGQQTIDYAVEAMRVGAFDYITKPLEIRHVQAAVRRALSHHNLLIGKRQYETQLEELVKERTAEVQHLAYYDQLTDLPNRTLFADRCTQALNTAQREQQPVGVLLVSLDRFKTITDTLGHAAGDVVLAESASRLQSCVRQGDTVSRFEGEEFALLLTQLNNIDELAEISQSIRDALKPSFRLGGQEVYLTASIGVGIFPANGADTAMILRNAGAALFRARKIGGDNYQFYAAEMNAQSSKRLALETDLRRAVEHREFITYYQPVVSLATRRIVGMEALVRWQHPELGIVPPADFIGLAEDTGLVVDIGALVLRTACLQTRAWQARGFRRLRVAVNISARQLQQASFLDQVVQVLDETGLESDCLGLELTETSIIENAESAAELLTELRKLGVSVAIDDFGTGYSSLSYLKQLPIDTVKLDRSFVNDATTNPDDAALVMAVVTLAHNLRLKVIAEGVETEEQMNFLRLLRCDEGQGYLFSKPVPANVFEDLMVSESRLKQFPPAARRDHVRGFQSVVNE
jgi:diguanylate cyclase (GGDEF)-like protein